MTAGTLHRISAFTDTPNGGNPAGVWIGETLPAVVHMQRIAAEVGYSETAFVAPANGDQRAVRYYSPEAEVPFCGHATIAAGFVLGSECETTYRLSTAVGEVPVRAYSHEGRLRVSLTSVAPRQKPVPPGLLDETLDTLGWRIAELDPAIPPMLANAGAWHLVLAASTHERLAALDYDFDALRSLMLQHGLTTVQIIWQENDRVFHSRNPFPVGGIVEDPATGAAAAALGGYLRDSGLLDAPAQIEIRQGDTMGRPSRLFVDIPASGGITVSGTAVPLAWAGEATE